MSNLPEDTQPQGRAMRDDGARSGRGIPPAPVASHPDFLSAHGGGGGRAWPGAPVSPSPVRWRGSRHPPRCHPQGESGRWEEGPPSPVIRAQDSCMCLGGWGHLMLAASPAWGARGGRAPCGDEEEGWATGRGSPGRACGQRRGAWKGQCGRRAQDGMATQAGDLS